LLFIVLYRNFSHFRLLDPDGNEKHAHAHAHALIQAERQNLTSTEFNTARASDRPKLEFSTLAETEYSAALPIPNIRFRANI
jgi:hypothetical protein